MHARGLTLGAVFGLLAAASARAQPQVPVPEPVPPDTSRVLTGARTEFHVIERAQYLRRHAFSLDHFLEFEPGGVLARLGPIGNDAFWSRLGIGQGRAVAVQNGIPLNDPQDGRAPYAHVATSGIGRLTLDAAPWQIYGPSIEGSLAIDEMQPPAARPYTFIELSKGTNAVRQRRVRFGSQAGRIGLDLAYDEVLDDGYNFDANQIVSGPPFPEGNANSRNAAVVVRGDLAGETRYSIGLRRFRAATTGDLQSAGNEATRSGHVAWATVGASGTATVYGRGYDSVRPDSSAQNETVGGVARWDAGRGDVRAHLFALGEHTNATQRIGGAQVHTRVNSGVAGAGAETTVGGFTAVAWGNVGGDEKSWAWGAGASAGHSVPRGEVTLSARRTFRLPSLGERYAPEHVRDNLLLSGNQALEAEVAWEGAATWALRLGPVTNRVRGSWMRSEDFIAYRPVAGKAFSRLALNSDDRPVMTFVEERVGVAAMAGRIEVRADAGAYFSTGDREGAFRSVPPVQVNAALDVGTQLFERSSAVYVGGDYSYMDERKDYRGAALPSYHVLNLSLVWRLIDAHLYLRWLNLLDAQYETVSGYRMTPRTLAYGIEWTLFD